MFPVPETAIEIPDGNRKQVRSTRQEVLYRRAAEIRVKVVSAYADFTPAGASNLLGSTDCIRGIVAVMEVPLPGLEVILKRPP